MVYVVDYCLFEVCWIDFRILFILVTVTFLEIEWMCKKVVEDAEKMEAVLLLGQSWVLFLGFCFFFTCFFCLLDTWKGDLDCVHLQDNPCFMKICQES